MRRYFLRALGAHLRGGRALFALAVAGVALGVGAVLSIQILNQSALGAFTGSVRALSGDAQLSVVGRGPTLPDELLPEVLGTAGVAAARPLLRLEVALEGERGAALELAGADLFSAAGRRPFELPRVRLAEVLARPGWVAVTPQLARERGWAPGTKLAVSLGSRRATLEVGALVDFQRVAPLASRRLAVMDLAQAQALLGAAGRVSQLDVVAAPGASVEDLTRRLEARLGPGYRAVTPEQRVAEAGALLAAFRLNLTALSAVSLFVGGFLVYASTQAALARRREELGVLRCLGATRAQVLALVLGDALVLGALGTAAGVPLGWLAARANVGAVSATLRNLYLLEGVEAVTLGPGLVALGVGLGLLGALAGAVLPALDVAREDPRALLSRRAEASPGRTPPRLAALGLLALAASAALALGPLRRWPYAGFGLALGVLAAVPLAAPLLLRAAGRLRPPRRLGVAFGARDLAAHLRATAVPAGALAVAVSMLVGITVMIGSFRHTVEDWLSATLRADVYVTSPSWRRGRTDAVLAPEVVARLAAAPGVRRVERLRQVTGEVLGRRVPVSGFDAAPAAGRVQLLAGDPAAALAKVAGEGQVLVSEPLARKAGLAPGDRLAIDFPAAGARAGPRRYVIAGVYRDYGSEGGAILMDLAALAEAAGPGPLTNVALDLAPGADVEGEVARLRREFQGEALVVRSNRTLRTEVLAIFEQTFAVTRLLQGMSLVVAVAGVALALLVLARERSAEVALLRALGATRGQIFRLFVGRALGIALAGLVLGAAGGAGLALVLVQVINPAWFGWSLALHAPWRVLASQGALLLTAAVAAGIYPAARASRTPATELARDAL
ncbi:FtsX-like permease family protein [Anaeromyxobacter diazotrophicus]|uniref:Permease n=1 Tax=Anaeromyxobacter diazotrophicus TaxID=2590199 RepID=A0A7I9VP49_9BACT|nr:FtsX-like permease family protein [Anaeromyxobacter diazotrophicus]GEJ58182.1 permease [Anaeromyxobacter diazotrophicus]